MQQQPFFCTCMGSQWQSLAEESPLLLSKQEDMFLLGRKVLSTLRNKKNTEFAQSHAAGQRQERGERSGHPLPSDTTDRPTASAQNRVYVLDRRTRLTLTPREVQ